MLYLGGKSANFSCHTRLGHQKAESVSSWNQKKQLWLESHTRFNWSHFSTFGSSLPSLLSKRPLFIHDLKKLRPGIRVLTTFPKKKRFSTPPIHTPYLAAITCPHPHVLMKLAMECHVAPMRCSTSEIEHCWREPLLLGWLRPFAQLLRLPFQATFRQGVATKSRRRVRYLWLDFCWNSSRMYWTNGHAMHR